MSVRLDPAAQAWMIDERTRAVLRALTADGGAARFVGGAVRNALLGAPVSDVDIATPLEPPEVMRRLQAAGLGAVPTGIEHGTVTAISSGKPYEVTTLRRDVETDGRRAVVAFTQDWRQDASRRDFTMNALYADEAGAVFDYFGGVADLQAGRVRFVGDARTRIREDYLRILRLFRFHAWYGKGEIDADALAASVAEKAGLKTLSGERVQKELLRLLEANDPVPVLHTMQQAGILAEALPSDVQLERLQGLAAVDRENGLDVDALLRLAALLSDAPDVARSIAARLRLSNAGRDRLIAAVSANDEISATLTREQMGKLLYRLGPSYFCDRILLEWAAGGRDEQWRALLSYADRWRPPRFPIDGRDVTILGIDEGPEVGALLREVEDWWIAQDFKPDRNALLARLREAAAKNTL